MIRIKEMILKSPQLFASFLLVLVFSIGYKYCEYKSNKESKSHQRLLALRDSLIKAELIAKWGVNYKFRIDSADREKAEIGRQAMEIINNRKYSSKALKLHKKHLDWSLEDCQNIINRRIWIGMTYDMLIYERGKPNTVNTSNYGNGNQYQACWDDYTPSCFYCGADDIITAYN